MSDGQPSSDFSVEMKDCKYCCSRIPRAASFCSICRSYQDFWRNWIIFLAGIVGLLSVIGAGLTYTLTTVISNIRGYLPQKEVEIVDLISTPGLSTNITIEDLSDKPIFVSSIIFYWRDSTAVVEIRKSIDPHKTINIKDEVKLDFITPNAASKNGELPAVLYKYVSTTYNKEDKSHCILASFSSINNPATIMKENFYIKHEEKLDIEPAELQLFYSDPDSGKLMFTRESVVTSFVVFPATVCDNSTHVPR